MLREASDDIRRWLRDKEVNNALYWKVTEKSLVKIKCQNIQVSDIIQVEKNQRVPADMILLRTSEANGTCFIRTDQLDGETDWKLRVAPTITQSMPSDVSLLESNAFCYCDKPHLDINTFIGNLVVEGANGKEELPLNVENTLWKDTVVANGTAVGVVIYTGADARSVMNTSKPSNKIGLVDYEVNFLTKILGIFLVVIIFIMVILQGFRGNWLVLMLRYMILLSAIIPVSLRVNLDIAKLVYCIFVQRDKLIPETVVRTTTIPEELGRINYLLADKTGTLTQNEMVFKKLHVGSIALSKDAEDEIRKDMEEALTMPSESVSPRSKKVFEAVMAVALCHNVSPVVSQSESDPTSSTQTYQASSPDEVALVKWIESIGLRLIFRDQTKIQLQTPSGRVLTYNILQLFPFSSERKRMGIIVENDESKEIVFYVKGADSVIGAMSEYTDWLDEESGNMAREGLRTLAYALKPLTARQYEEFQVKMAQAALSIQDRVSRTRLAIETLEQKMKIIGLTGVEDKLQMDVRPTLESIRYAGVKVWMLTGDKLETALCIAKSSRLISPNQKVFIVGDVGDRMQAHQQMNTFRRKSDCALVISGDSVSMILKHYESDFMNLAIQCPAVVVCRCTPTEKEQVVKLIQKHTGKRCAAVGDGGNDVSMIQAANAGIGIEGKEGKQAAMAADFSITQFRFIGRLFLVHGRNSYKRSAALAQFVMHRGMIISMMQAIFSACFYFTAVSLYHGFLIVGYATLFTVLPVFSLVFDKDVRPDVALMYPELYKELLKGRCLTLKTFLIWVLVSIYQASILMFGALLLFNAQFLHIVPISFTGLVLTEWIMVCLTIETWIWVHAVAILFSVACYTATVFIDTATFTPDFVLSWEFVWKVVVITVVSCLPIYAMKILRKTFSPAAYSKLN